MTDGPPVPSLHGTANRSSSKAAVDHVARIQALEWGQHGVRVNSVRPTVVLTELAKKAWDADKLKMMQNQIPLRKLAEPQDVANAVAWLLSDHAGMVSGSSIPVDGGRAMGGCGLQRAKRRRRRAVRRGIVAIGPPSLRNTTPVVDAFVRHIEGL